MSRVRGMRSRLIWLQEEKILAPWNCGSPFKTLDMVWLRCSVMEMSFWFLKVVFSSEIFKISRTNTQFCFCLDHSDNRDDHMTAAADLFEPRPRQRCRVFLNVFTWISAVLDPGQTVLHSWHGRFVLQRLSLSPPFHIFFNTIEGSERPQVWTHLHIKQSNQRLWTHTVLPLKWEDQF